MIDIARSNAFATYVVGRLPEDYLITSTDVSWLEECSNLLTGGLTSANVLQAVKDAVEKHGDTMHVDPYELLVDAGICDAELNLVDSPPS